MKEIVSCAVVGVTGRMGQHVCRLLSQAEDFTIAGATEAPGSRHIGRSLTETIGLPGEQGLIAGSLEDIQGPIDVVIDFTFPEVTMRTVEFARTCGVRTVIGTTGFSLDQMSVIEKSSCDFPCVCAPNMSMGVNTLFKIVEDVARILNEGYDAEVLEIHHRHKKDAPSGTAVRIGQILAETWGRDYRQTAVFERNGIIGERTRDEIGMQTLRAGDVVGEHTVLFGGTGERLELIHRAQSRDCFAQGALQAARWLKSRSPGLYDMQDVLGLR
jgi:4-hydroxy-tetrahydrodipicolinate reductase